MTPILDSDRLIESGRVEALASFGRDFSPQNRLRLRMVLQTKSGCCQVPSNAIPIDMKLCDWIHTSE